MAKEVLPMSKPLKKYGKSAIMADYLSFKSGLKALKRDTRELRIAENRVTRLSRRVKATKRRLLKAL